MNLLSFQKRNCAKLFLALLIMLSGAVPALAETIVDMRDSRSKETVSCKILEQDQVATGLPSNALMEWCIKACEIHGFDQVSGFDVIQVSDFAINPTLPLSEWPLAKKITPQQCLPYEPFSLEKQGEGGKCLPYGVRTEITGLLANYAGWGWTIKAPRPNCTVEDSTDRFHKPGGHNLNGITLKLPPHVYSRYKKLVGHQITVSGKLQLVIKADTANLTLKDVRLVSVNRVSY